MGLIERLIGAEQPKLPVHQFTAALGELERTKWTRAQVITALGILPAEEGEMDALIAKVVPVPECYTLGGYTVLTALGTTYDATAQGKGLGFVPLEGRGITGIEFRPRFNKIGTGTLSFQLWNETTAAELTVVDDAVVGDNKAPVVTYTPGAPVPGGTHILRVRSKNSTAAQAPVYYGSSLRVRRIDVMWSRLLEEVMVLAEKGYAPLEDAAAVRARLGI